MKPLSEKKCLDPKNCPCFITEDGCVCVKCGGIINCDIDGGNECCNPVSEKKCKICRKVHENKHIDVDKLVELAERSNKDNWRDELRTQWNSGDFEDWEGETILAHKIEAFIDSLLIAQRKKIIEVLKENGHGGGNWRRLLEQLEQTK